MPEIAADPPVSSCYRLYSRPRFQEAQLLGPDPSSPRARDARGRFAKGSSGNPRGIHNPRRRVPDLAARPLSAPALSDLIDRKPQLLPPLAEQLLPPHAPRRMDGDVIEDRAKIGKGRKSVAKPHRPCLAHTVRTCSSVANSPRAAAAFEAVMAACSSGVSETGGSSSAPLSRSTTRAMSSCASAGRPRAAASA
jgi:hypothetical protein